MISVERYAHCVDSDGNERFHAESPCRVCQDMNDRNGPNLYVSLEDYNKRNEPLSWLREKIESMPTRTERLGGQQTKYLDRSEVLDWIEEAWRPTTHIGDLAAKETNF